MGVAHIFLRKSLDAGVVLVVVRANERNSTEDIGRCSRQRQRCRLLVGVGREGVTERDNKLVSLPPKRVDVQRRQFKMMLSITCFKASLVILGLVNIAIADADKPCTVHDDGKFYDLNTLKARYAGAVMSRSFRIH